MYENEHNVNSVSGERTNNSLKGTKITIIGVGGGGGNAINLMKEKDDIQGVKYVAINTDEQDLLTTKSKADFKLSLDNHLGAGGDPEIARQLAEDKKSEIKKIIQDNDMIFITAGMGGGTGTGASPVVARLAKEEGVLTIAIVTTPFSFEGPRRRKNADLGLEELRKYVDTLIVIPNDRISKNKIPGISASLRDTFTLPNTVLLRAVKGISEVVTKIGLINVDFADLRKVMESKGDAVIGLGETREGEDISEAIKWAVSNPLLDRDIKGAKNILLNITVWQDADFSIFETVAESIREYTENEELDYMLGVVLDPELKEGEAKITVVATGFDDVSSSIANTIEKERETNVSKNETVDSIIVPNLANLD